MADYKSTYSKVGQNPAYRYKKVKRGGIHTSTATGGNLMRSSASSIAVDVSDCFNGIIDRYEREAAAIMSVAAAEAKSMASEAARTAPWKDRGDGAAKGRSARSSIRGFTSTSGLRASIVVKGGEGVYDVRKGGKRPYFHYLEAAMGRRFATVKPTVNRRAADVVHKVASALLRG